MMLLVLWKPRVARAAGPIKHRQEERLCKGLSRAVDGGVFLGYVLAVFSESAYLPAAALAIGLAVGWASLGCNDVSRFTTAPDERYCGSIVPGPFVRKGFEPGVSMRMSFDSDRLGDLPGVLSTSDGLLKEAPLRPIPQLANDALYALEFGDGRTRNLLLAVGPTDGQTAFVVVSLMENGGTEVRILRGAPPPPGSLAKPANDGPELFGVFPLAKQKGTCGF